MRKIILLLILILLISTNLLYAAEITTDEWKSDLDYLKKELPLRHNNLFFELSQAEFNREIEALKNEMAELSSLEITLKMTEIFAKIGDRNTALDNTPYLKEYYPFRLKKFADGYRVMAVNKDNKEILGSKLIAINDFSIEELKNKFSTLITADNQFALEYRLSSFLNLTDVLKYLNIIDQKNSFLFKEGENYFKVNFEAKRIENIEDNADQLIKLDYQKRQFSAKNDQLFYMENFKEEADKIINIINYREINKFIIDLRNNNGDYSRVVELAEKLTPFKNEIDFYVIIGAETYSTAIFNALNFKYKLDAFLVGYPTLTKVNHFGGVKSFILPNSKLKISYSTKYYKILTNIDPDSLYPDIMVETEFEDFLNGRDTVLEIIRTIDSTKE